jgi:hypothetical protein
MKLASVVQAVLSTRHAAGSIALGGFLGEAATANLFSGITHQKSMNHAAYERRTKNSPGI